ncbi:hypothetical protein NQZ79_g7304 [Umbelopsis isabellina]|nr:hypothetical protein NQZ79_g7304 [Umbelopsis isabellina]
MYQFSYEMSYIAASLYHNSVACGASERDQYNMKGKPSPDLEALIEISMSANLTLLRHVAGGTRSNAGDQKE